MSLYFLFTWITNISNLSLFPFFPLHDLHCSTITQYSIYTIFQITYCELFNKKVQFHKEFGKKKFLFLSAQQADIKAAKQYIYLPIDSKRENVLKLFDTSASSRFQGGKLEDWNSVCALLFERYRGRWNGWLMTLWAVHTIRAHVSDIPRHGPSLFTLWLGNLKHSNWTEEQKHVYDTVSYRCCFFLSSFFFFFTSKAKAISFCQSRIYVRANPPNSKTKDPNVILFSFSFIRYMVARYGYERFGWRIIL